MGDGCITAAVTNNAILVRYVVATQVMDKTISHCYVIANLYAVPSVINVCSYKGKIRKGYGWWRGTRRRTATTIDCYV